MNSLQGGLITARAVDLVHEREHDASEAGRIRSMCDASEPASLDAIWRLLYRSARRSLQWREQLQAEARHRQVLQQFVDCLTLAQVGADLRQ